MALGFDIREADTEEAAQTAEARGRRSVAAARAGVEQITQQPQAPVAPQAPQALPAETGDPFGDFVNILKNVASLGIRPLVKDAIEQRNRRQALEDFNTVTTATQNMQSLFGGLNKGPERTAAAEAHLAQLDQARPGLGAVVRTAWEAVENQGLNLPSTIEHRDKAIAFCGTGSGAQKCMTELFTDEKLIKKWDEEADQTRLPDIMNHFNVIVDAARQAGGDNVLKQLSEGGWDLAELQRLPEQFAFTENQMRTINRNEQIQNSLISVGLNPASLDVKREEAEITEAAKARFREPKEPTKTNLAKLQDERALAETAGDTRKVDELNKKIRKEITIVGRTPEDVRTGLTGATPKDLDELRSGIRILQGNLEDVEKTRKAFEETPEAAGFTGAVLESVGGVLEQFPFIGGDLAEMLPGDQEKVKKARTRAKFLAGSLLTTITKEESGRFTDTERRIADDALAALQAATGPGQTQTALETALEIMTESQNRNVDELLTASGLDLSTEAGINSFNKVLLENRFTAKQAEDVIFDIMGRRGLSLE